MTVMLPLSDNACVALVSVYAPTMTNQDENKEAFYQQLDKVVSSVPGGDKLIGLRDLNVIRLKSYGMGWHCWSTWYVS